MTVILFQFVLLIVKTEPSSFHAAEQSPTIALTNFDRPLTYVMLLPRPLPSAMMSATALLLLENVTVTSPVEPCVLNTDMGSWDTESRQLRHHRPRESGLRSLYHRTRAQQVVAPAHLHARVAERDRHVGERRPGLDGVHPRLQLLVRDRLDLAPRPRRGDVLADGALVALQGVARRRLARSAMYISAAVSNSIS